MTVQERLIGEADLQGNDLLAWLSRPAAGLELDVGCGTGQFLCEAARIAPHRRFLGIEIREDLSRRTLMRIKRYDLVNARVVTAEAHQFIRTYLGAESVAMVHIYFPTPFPKRTIAINRLVTRDFIRECHRVLEPLGGIRLATDHEGYYSAAKKLFFGGGWWPQAWQRMSLGQPSHYVVGTPLEKMARERLHHEIFYLQAHRVVDSRAGSFVGVTISSLGERRSEEADGNS